MKYPIIKLMMSTKVRFALLITTINFAVCTQAQQRPQNIEELFRNFFNEYVQLRPETGTSIGIPPEWDIVVRNDALDDESEYGIQKIYDLYRKYHSWVSEYDQERLSSSQRIAASVLKWFLENELEGERFSNHTYTINPLFGLHGTFVTMMTEHHRISSVADAQDYIQRLRKIEMKVGQLLERMKIQEEKRIIPPSYIVGNYLQLLNEFISVSCEQNLLYTSFYSRIVGIEGITNGTKRNLCMQAANALEDNVYPAYKRMIEQVEILLQKADQNAGVWKLPDGDEYYRYCLRNHTTTNMTPEQVHNLGLEEVERIQKELKRQFRKLGITGNGEFSDLLGQYMQISGNTADEKYFFPSTEEGKIQTILSYQAIIDSIKNKLPLMFSVIPRTTVNVARVPEYKVQVIGTYYQQPKLDGSEGGIFYANLSYQHQKSGMKALTYHEAIPGHHLQIALEQEHSEARVFKTLFFFTGYVEGWALYAEKLAGEYGFYGDTESLIGYLRSELFRALRLVIDTGIHYKKWTRERAYEYLLSNLGWGSYSEIDRYIVWPGQACAYKIGELKLLELRARAKSRLGDEFDIRKFHDVVLRHGSVPLAVLDSLVEEYIKSYGS
ncbi:MAG: DUF885 domain-containing protein [candidate division WOR-3 bacterium]|nr:DUF885 domain-containing protein [candidate division WOR-3 bacterium]